MRRTIAVAAFAALTLSGCGGEPEQEPTPLEPLPATSTPATTQTAPASGVALPPPAGAGAPSTTAPGAGPGAASPDAVSPAAPSPGTPSGSAPAGSSSTSAPPPVPVDAPICERLTDAEVKEVVGGGTVTHMEFDATQCVYLTEKVGDIAAMVAPQQMVDTLPAEDVVDLPELRINGVDKVWLHEEAGGTSIVVRQGSRHLSVSGERISRDQAVALTAALVR